MRHVAISLALMLAGQAAAFEIEDHAAFGPPEAPRLLRILSTADIDYFAPVILAFLEAQPGMRVDYTVASSTELMRALHEEGQAFDLAISSAMDLQTKLANDGLARRHTPAISATLPDWAVWNGMVFAFSQEPATIVLSRAAFDGLPLPTDRQSLLSVLRRHPERFRGRVGTYDIETSGLGYLFATQDARQSETFWRLTEVMGGLGLRLYCCSSYMIRDVRNGRLAVAYNVLGSYAASQPSPDDMEIVLPGDFTTVMLRTMLIPVTSDAPQTAGTFIDFVLEKAFGAGGDVPSLSQTLDTRTGLSRQRIRLGPGLLVYLDQFKRRRFIAAWRNATRQE